MTIYERGERAMVGAGSNGRVRAAWLWVADPRSGGNEISKKANFGVFILLLPPCP